MHMAQVIGALCNEGFLASKGRIRNAINGGHISPKPEKDSQGARVFTSEHQESLKWYLVHVRPGPRSPLQQEYPLKGYHDRLRRLARHKRQQARLAAQIRAERERRRPVDDAIEKIERYLRDGIWD